MAFETANTSELVRLAQDGGPEALGDLFARYRDRLLRMVSLRMDRRLRNRLDPADVLQEAYLEASVRFLDYMRNREMPFFLWLRFITAQKLLALHRQHLGVQARDASREISLYSGRWPEATSDVLAAQLLGRRSTPSQAVMRTELQIRLQELLNAMNPIDREVLTLRHFEQLSNSEAARVLGISETAASSRHLRAVARLRETLMGTPGFLDREDDESSS